MENNKRYNVVAAMVMDKGEILCVQKPQTKYSYTSYHWEFPGGKVEPGETESEALRRELIEEMDYPIQVLGLLANVHHDYSDFSVDLHFYLCTPDDIENPRKFTLKEHVNYAWTRPERIPFVGDFCAADYHISADENVVALLSGTKFQKDVWRALCHIPLGETRTYAEVARMAGHQNAVRAVAHAIHCNPLPYFIPCHRVIPASGGIGQYAYGADLKKRLLELEKK